MDPCQALDRTDPEAVSWNCILEHSPRAYLDSGLVDQVVVVAVAAAVDVDWIFAAG